MKKSNNRFMSYSKCHKKWLHFNFKVSLLQCNYTFKYWVMIINYMYLLSVLGKLLLKVMHYNIALLPKK